MLLCELFEGAEEKEIRGIFTDSRKLKPGGVFVCLKGTKADGHQYIADAVCRGAAGILAEREIPACPIPVRRVGNTVTALAALAEHYYQDPSKKLRIIGITGTNGKTTASYLIKAMLNASGRACGLIGTNEILIGETTSAVQSTMPTTPDALELAEIFSELVKAGISDVVMEVSSHALALGRVAHLQFETAVYTNLTQDHLDFHRTMHAYQKAKEQLFRQCRNAVVNIRDAVGASIASRCTCPCLTVGTDTAALFFENLQASPDGTSFLLRDQDTSIPIRLPLLGRYNAENALCAIGAAKYAGISLAEIQSGLASVRGIRGRLERLPINRDFQVLIDYAHSPDGLKNVLTTLRPLTDGRLIVLFGCGGDRDRSKRAQMGQIAESLADLAILTSDNPRTESPSEIIHEIRAGFSGTAYRTIPDRREAIFYALSAAAPGDVILLAGKGQETYQLLGQEKIPFDEREIVRLWCKTHP